MTRGEAQDRERPPDGDDGTGRRVRPVHLQARSLALVAVGGAVGTAARVGVSRTVPPVGGLPVPTIVVNITGAFALGLLLEALARRGPDEGRRRVLRLLLGTGFCGGFTTYSSFAVETALGATSPASSAAILLITVLVGGLAAAAGIAVGARTRS